LDLLTAAILGLVQALTEFLPVSSSGHLVLTKALLGVEVSHGAAFEVAVHFGTLLSVLVIFRAEVLALFGALGRLLRSPSTIAQQRAEDPHTRMGLAIVVGCIPAGVVGLTMKDTLEQAFDSPTLVCGALLGTGVILLATLRANEGDGEVGLGGAVLIGIAQAVAILPGVSRSGATIAAALFLGVERNLAARYSFLLSLPVIAGATLLKVRDLLAAPPEGDVWVALGLGALVAFVAGMAALAWLLRLVRSGWFAHFGWYCLGVGGLGLALL
jgi:undecaprenyl-diphosphatase